MRWGLVLTCLYMAFGAPTGKPTAPSTTSIIVVGSLNADIIIPVHRLPSRGETITARSPASQIAVGGKGANQAVAAARLTAGTPRKTRFICRFGNDAYAGTMEAALVEAGVDVSGCGHAPDLPSGQGIVLLEADGTASSVVLGGANTAWGDASLPTPNTKEGKVNKGLSASHIVDSAGMVLLQREIPEEVNLAVARAAHHADIPVLLDVGGEDRPLSDEMLRLVTYLAPNESELQRLTGMPTANDSAAVAAAQTLIQRGARSVLVTLAERGSLLVKAGGVVLQQAAVPVPGGKVVDGTAAGDAFRAAFAVALVEGWPEQASMEFAAAAGAVAVSRMGAVPSLPSKDELLPLLSPEVRSLAETRAGTGVGAQADKNNGDAQTCSETCNGGEAESTGSPSSSTTASRAPVSSSAFPYKFASRLNSMQARRDLVTGKEESANDVFGWIARQGHIRGLDLVDFNYPQHLQGQSLRKITAALTAAGLRTGAICIRFPEIFHLGAFSNPNATLRAQAVALAVDGCRWAADLGARDLIVWSPYDGYDYHFQVEYQAAWQRSVEAFQQLADACPPGENPLCMHACMEPWLVIAARVLHVYYHYFTPSFTYILSLMSVFFYRLQGFVCLWSSNPLMKPPATP